MNNKALGEITEAQIYYDFENPPWIKYLSAKEYTPGAGLLFGLGKRENSPHSSAFDTATDNA